MLQSKSQVKSAESARSELQSQVVYLSSKHCEWYRLGHFTIYIQFIKILEILLYISSTDLHPSYPWIHVKILEIIPKRIFIHF